VFHVILLAPEIPPNTGNVIRLCANTGAHLHLVEPLGFSMEDRLLRRAGLDYHELVDVTVHRDWTACLAALGERRIFAFSTRARRLFTEVAFERGDALLFGAETAGLPAELLARFPEDRCLRLPMRPGNRSLNLSNAVAVAVFEAWRQHDFAQNGHV
jgi:tRNA (cytidine/uridine-2'-O-)-methyltransferase